MGASMMNPAQRAAMSQALGSAPPPPDMPPPQGGPMPGGPGGHPPGAGGPPGGGAPMAPEQAQQVLSSLGITPDNLPMVIQAIDAVMQSGGGGTPPPA